MKWAFKSLSGGQSWSIVQLMRQSIPQAVHRTIRATNNWKTNPLDGPYLSHVSNSSTSVERLRCPRNISIELVHYAYLRTSIFNPQSWPGWTQIFRKTLRKEIIKVSMHIASHFICCCWYHIMIYALINLNIHESSMQLRSFMNALYIIMYGND